MTPEQKLAYIMATCTRATIRAMGMQAENAQHQDNQPYSINDFNVLIFEEGLRDDQVHNFLVGE